MIIQEGEINSGMIGSIQESGNIIFSMIDFFIESIFPIFVIISLIVCCKFLINNIFQVRGLILNENEVIPKNIFKEEINENKIEIYSFGGGGFSKKPKVMQNGKIKNIFDN